MLGAAAPAWLERHGVTARLVAPDGGVPAPAAGRPTRTSGSRMTDGPLLWYLNRSTGLVLLVLLTLTVVLGVLSTGRPAGARRARASSTQSLHRNLALLSVVLLALTWPRPSSTPTSTSAGGRRSCPVGATYLPLWLGLGTVALDLIVAGGR